MAEAFIKYQLFMGHLEHMVSVKLGLVGKNAAIHPWKFIGGSLLFGFVFLVPGVLMMSSDAEDIWFDHGSESFLNNDWVETIYPPFASSDKLLITAKDGKSVLTKDIWDEMWDIFDDVKKIKVTEENSPGEKDCWNTKYEDVCVQINKKCIQSGATGFFQHDRAIYDAAVTSDSDILAAVRVKEWPGHGGEVHHAEILGGPVKLDSDDLPDEAKAMRMKWIVSGKCSEAWETEYLDYFMEDQRKVITKTFKHIKVNVQASTSGTDELSRNVSGDIMKFAMVFVLMITVTIVVLGRPLCLPPPNIVKNRASLAGAEIGMVLFGMGSGYGFSFICGIPFTLLGQILPFIIIGIGIDDALVVSAAFDATDKAYAIDERMEQAMSRCGTSVTFTSLTDMIAFALGYTSKLPAVQYFCFMGVWSIFFLFVFHLTWFPAMLALDARRQNGSKADCCCCIGARNNEDGSSPSASKKMMKAFGKGLVSHIAIKAGILFFFFAVFIAGLVTMITDTKTGFDLLDITPDASYLREMYLAEEDWFGIRSQDDNIPAIVYFKDVDVKKPEVQAELWKTCDELQDLKMMEGSKNVSAWFKEWHKYVQARRMEDTDNAAIGVHYPDAIEHDLEEQTAGSGENKRVYYTGSKFFQSIEEWTKIDYAVVERDVTLWVDADGAALLTDDNGVGLTGMQPVVATPAWGGRRFKDDIIFNEKKDNIETFRMYAFHVDMVGSEPQTKGLTEVEDFYRKKAAKSFPGMMIVNSAYPLYDQYRIIVMELITTFLMVIVAVIFISFFILIHPTSVFLVSVVLVMVFVELFAAVRMWGLEVNSLTGVCLICSIGLVVDYTAHIVHSFSIQNPNLSRDERVIDTLFEMGAPVMVGVLTTLIGVIPLAFAGSETFRVFFKMFLSMVVVGGAHGLVFVPVVLSFVGPVLAHQKALDASEVKQVGPADAEIGKPKAAWKEDDIKEVNKANEVIL